MSVDLNSLVQPKIGMTIPELLQRCSTNNEGVKRHEQNQKHAYEDITATPSGLLSDAMTALTSLVRLVAIDDNIENSSNLVDQHNEVMRSMLQDVIDKFQSALSNCENKDLKAGELLVQLLNDLAQTGELASKLESVKGVLDHELDRLQRLLADDTQKIEYCNTQITTYNGLIAKTDEKIKEAEEMSKPAVLRDEPLIWRILGALAEGSEAADRLEYGNRIPGGFLKVRQEAILEKEQLTAHWKDLSDELNRHTQSANTKRAAIETTKQNITSIGTALTSISTARTGLEDRKKTCIETQPKLNDIRARLLKIHGKLADAAATVKFGLKGSYRSVLASRALEVLTECPVDVALLGQMRVIVFFLEQLPDDNTVKKETLDEVAAVHARIDGQLSALSK
ncbi:hypothetical protein TWF696_009695 [Orbilia brochopaga]|uniref:Uncharacterized protein n=1 Tax=Orbilia brochopaga TaxID=3140254 RepID=A0AAV9UG68_9PEZI